MNNNNYTITMPLKDYEKYKQIEQSFNDLKRNISDTFIPNDDIGVITINITQLIDIGKTLLPLRYQEYNYTEVR